MARQYDFSRNQILRAEFLNNLQSILTSYVDNFLLTYAGTKVLAQALTTDPIAITIDQHMRKIPYTLEAIPTGAAGSRDVYIALRENGFTLEALPVGTFPSNVPLPPEGELVEVPSEVTQNTYRKVGTCTWNGSAVTGVYTIPVRTNADYLGGRKSTFIPAPHKVAVADVNGRLHPDWFPEVQEKATVIGTIARMWAPSNALFVIPTDWVEMRGQTLTSGQHSFPGVSSFVVPDMRNKVPRGANPSLSGAGRTTAATATNSSSGAPGFDAVAAGTNNPIDFTHFHSQATHQHFAPAHDHTNAHTHTVPSHVHRWDDYSAGNTTGGFFSQKEHRQGDQSLDPGVGGREEIFRHGYGTNGASRWGSDAGDPNVTTTSAVIGDAITAESGDTTLDGASSVSTSGTTHDIRPASVGLVFLLKVH